MPELLELIREMRAGLACLPEGPWRYSPWHIEEDNAAVRVKEGWLLCSLPSDDYAKHIALCSRENIAKLLDAAESALQQPGGWEAFCDESYFGLWAVRRVGEKSFGKAFHVASKEEAEALVLLLPATPPHSGSSGTGDDHRQ